MLSRRRIGLPRAALSGERSRAAGRRRATPGAPAAAAVRGCRSVPRADLRQPDRRQAGHRRRVRHAARPLATRQRAAIDAMLRETLERSAVLARARSIVVRRPRERRARAQRGDDPLRPRPALLRCRLVRDRAPPPGRPHAALGRHAPAPGRRGRAGRLGQDGLPAPRPGRSRPRGQGPDLQVPLGREGPAQAAGADRRAVLRPRRRPRALDPQLLRAPRARAARAHPQDQAAGGAVHRRGPRPPRQDAGRPQAADGGGDGRRRQPVDRPLRPPQAQERPAAADHGGNRLPHHDHHLRGHRRAAAALHRVAPRTLRRRGHAARPTSSRKTRSSCWRSG